MASSSSHIDAMRRFQPQAGIGGIRKPEGLEGSESASASPRNAEEGLQPSISEPAHPPHGPQLDDRSSLGTGLSASQSGVAAAPPGGDSSLAGPSYETFSEAKADTKGNMHPGIPLGGAAAEAGGGARPLAGAQAGQTGEMRAASSLAAGPSGQSCGSSHPAYVLVAIDGTWVQGKEMFKVGVK